MLLIDLLNEYLGPVPSGYDVVVYALGCVLLIWLLRMAFNVVISVLNWIAGKR